MKKLPAKTKTGKTLVATAADGRIGLYCKGKPRKETSKYLIVNLKGKKMRSLMGSGGYPIAPNDLKWLWLDKQERRKKKRRDAKQYVDPRAGRSVAKNKKPLKLSESVRCQECRRDVTKLSHAHTLAHPERGYAQTFCCKCRRMMGYTCAYKDIKELAAESRERLVAKGVLPEKDKNTNLKASLLDVFKEKWTVVDEYEERWIAA